MSLNDKQRRGSAIGLGLPFKTWLVEPNGSIEDGDRASLVKLCSAVFDSGSVPDVVAPYQIMVLGYGVFGDYNLLPTIGYGDISLFAPEEPGVELMVPHPNRFGVVQNPGIKTRVYRSVQFDAMET